MSVYFIYLKELNAVKIGFTSNLTNRFKNLQSGVPGKLEVIRIIEADIKVEKLLHKVFHHKRIYLEWFHFDKKMLTITIPQIRKRARKIKNTKYNPKTKMIGVRLPVYLIDWLNHRRPKGKKWKRSSQIIQILKDRYEQENKK